MVQACQKFTSSIQTLQQIGNERLELFFHSMLPDEQFRFITFQNDDFSRQNVTYLLFNFIPERVFVMVEHFSDISAAGHEVGRLNPGVSWISGEMHYSNDTEGNRPYIVVELLLKEIPMHVNAQGILVGK